MERPMTASAEKNIRGYDSQSYSMYCGPQQRDKAFNSLIGILAGMGIDRAINSEEVAELKHWCDNNRHLSSRPPFIEIYAMLDSILKDDIVTDDELQDIIWCCNQNLGHGEYYNGITASIQYLQGMLHGIMADGEVSDEEICTLKHWLVDHDDMTGTYPYDELFSIITSVVKDGIITEDERNTLKVFFSEFFDSRVSLNIHEPELAKLREQVKVSGICALGPDVVFEGKTFCFSGTSARMSRSQIAQFIIDNGGTYHDTVVDRTDYLIIGCDGNDCWAYGCYGRKIEKAKNMRSEGHRIVIVHERDFWDAL